MTAEQLEELLGNIPSCELEPEENYELGWDIKRTDTCDMTNADETYIGWANSDQLAILWSIAPSLAHRVIAAEKLVQAAERDMAAWPRHMVEGTEMYLAVTAYREASK